MSYLLLLDYDGTLVPIKKHPKLARLTPSRRGFLRKLARRPNIKMAIISGRKLTDIIKMVGLSGLIYSGNHGFEIKAGKKQFILPAARRAVPVLKKIAKEMSKLIKIRGAWIENKGLTLSVHYRSVPKQKLAEFHESFSAALLPYRGRIKLTRGKKVYEIHPPLDWDKGKAVRWIIKELGEEKRLPIYIGDDRTDEDAFRAIRKKGVTIHVGPGKTAASIRTKDINGVYAYLKSLIKNES